MKRPLILVCGGGHCKSVIEAAESAGFAIKGILDVAERIGDDVLGYKIVGTDDDAARYAAECDFVVTLGFIKSAAVRNHIIDKLTAAGCRFATVVASTAHVSRHATLGEGRWCSIVPRSMPERRLDDIASSTPPPTWSTM